MLQFGDEIGWKSLRNVPEVHLLWAGQLNTYDVLNSDDVVFTRAALDEFLSASGRSVQAPPGQHRPARRRRRRGRTSLTKAATPTADRELRH